MTITDDPLVYAGFWRRLGANLLDVVVMLPYILFAMWLHARSPNAYAILFLPEMLMALVLQVWMVKRYGGSPGKLLAKLAIRRVDGSTVGYREAILRHLPDFTLNFLMGIASVTAASAISPDGYAELSFSAQSAALGMHLPAWYMWLQWLSGAWFVSELVVLLSNHKKRALHDFIAGTVVIRTKADETAPPAPAAAY